VWWHSVNYKAGRGGDVPGALVNRGFWLRLPRLMLACRVLGHRPVVDGTEGWNGQPGHRWVCCDRCGVRPDPQGVLRPSRWNIGDQFNMSSRDEGADRLPGGWATSPEGVIGGQVIVGGHVTAGIGFKVGNKGSEHVLAAHACIPWIGGLYLHTEGFGTWVQRRLNPVGYESRVTEVAVHNGRAWWQWWAARNGGGPKLPRWRHGNARVDPRDILLGERRYRYESGSAPVPGTLLMPDGGVHLVTMQLQRQLYGRARGRKRESWTVDCRCREGIPERNDRGGVTGWAVKVSDLAVENGMWQQEALAASIVKITETRVRYGYAPEAKAA
jgi:hypothetical protein